MAPALLPAPWGAVIRLAQFVGDLHLCLDCLLARLHRRSASGCRSRLSCTTHDERLRHTADVFADGDDLPNRASGSLGHRLGARAGICYSAVTRLLLQRLRVVDVEAHTIDRVGARADNLIEQIAGAVEVAYHDRDSIRGLIAGDRMSVLCVGRRDVEVARLDVLGCYA